MKFIASWSGGKAEFLRRTDMQELKIKGINKIAEIIICGVLHISVNECDGHTDFIVPTAEQRKNLKEMLCIDVKVFDEERSDNHDGE